MQSFHFSVFTVILSACFSHALAALQCCMLGRLLSVQFASASSSKFTPPDQTHLDRRVGRCELTWALQLHRSRFTHSPSLLQSTCRPCASPRCINAPNFIKIGQVVEEICCWICDIDCRRCCEQSTDGRRQFITLNVELCVGLLHDGWGNVARVSRRQLWFVYVYHVIERWNLWIGLRLNLQKIAQIICE